MNNIILLDGAMGTYLKELNVSYDDIPYLSITSKKILINLHEAYLSSGSEFINTNTFRLHPLIIKDSKLLSSLINNSLECASIAIKNKGIGKISYNIGPIGINNCDNEDSIYNSYHSIYSLIKDKENISCIFIETQYMLKEALIALEAFKECSIPLWLSFTFNKNGLLHSGENISEIISKINSYNVAALGCNCGSGPKDALIHVKEFKKYWNKQIIAKPNLGTPKEINNKLIYNVSTNDFSNNMQHLIDCGANIIGGCCGTNPLYIKAISDII